MYTHVHSHTHTPMDVDKNKLATCKDASTATTWRGRLPASWDPVIARNMKTTWGSMAFSWVQWGKYIYIYKLNMYIYIYTHTVISYNKKETVYRVSPNRILLEWLKFLSLFLHLLLPETRLALIEVKGSTLLLCYAQWPVHGDPWCSTLWRRDVNIVTIC